MSHRNEQFVYFLFVPAEPDAASQVSKNNRRHGHFLLAGWHNEDICLFIQIVDMAHVDLPSLVLRPIPIPTTANLP